MNMEEEILKEWKIIKEAEGYEVSNYGDVRNIKTQKLIVGSTDRDGYPRVMIKNNDGKRITRFRHRLAAQAFLENPNNYPVVNHKDENKGNAYVGTKENNYQDGNLEWCTIAYNVAYGEGAKRRAEKLKNNYSKGKSRVGRKSIITYVYNSQMGTVSGPTITTTSPLEIVVLILSSTCKDPKSLQRSFISNKTVLSCICTQPPLQSGNSCREQ